MRSVLIYSLSILVIASMPTVALADGHDVGVGVFQLPKTEHWRSNFKPDSYSLDDYSGRKGKAQSETSCDSGDRHTISTSRVECGESAEPATQSRTLSTK